MTDPKIRLKKASDINDEWMRALYTIDNKTGEVIRYKNLRKDPVNKYR